MDAPRFAFRVDAVDGKARTDRVDASPVVPHGTSALLPFSICQSTRRRKAGSSNDPSRKGVTRAGIEPENIATILAIALSAGRNPRWGIHSFSA